MSNEIFFSCASEEIEIASSIKDFLINFYGDAIRINFFDHDHVRGEWLERTRESLTSADTLIMLLSPIFQTKPWVFIELTPFWLRQNKNIFILCTDEQNQERFNLPLLREYDQLSITNPKHVLRFLESLSNTCGGKKPTLETVQTFLDAYRKGIEKAGLHRMHFANYTEFQVMRLYETGEYSHFLNTVENITDDVIKRRIALQLILAKDYKNSMKIIRSMYEIREVRNIATSLLNRGIQDSPLMEEILSKLEEANSELRIFARFMINNDMIDSPLFKKLPEHFSNEAELRNVGCHIINVSGMNDHVLRLSQHLRNAAELKNLLIWAIRQDEYRKPQFLEILKLIKNPGHRGYVKEAIMKADKNYWQENLEKHLTNTKH